MHFAVTKRRFARPLTAACVLLACTASAFGADTFSAGRLSIPSLTVGPVTYSNVVVAVGSIMSGPAGSSAIGSEDSYNYSTGQLTVPAVSVGAATYYNVVISVASVLSIGSVSGADSLSGADLNIGYVQVGSNFYSNVVVTASNFIPGTGMPAGAWDSYNASTHVLTIPAVVLSGQVYTNATVTVGSVISVGTGGGYAQTIQYTAPVPTLAPLKIGTSEAIAASASSTLPVTFVVTTPQTCAVVASSAQLQNFFFAYSASASVSGNGLMSGPPVGSSIFEIDSVASIFEGHPLGMLATSNPTTVNGIAYPVFSNGSFAYDNIAYANGGGFFDAAGLGMQVAGSDFNLYYAAGLGYLFTNNALSNQSPPYIPLSFTVAEVNGLVGLANGTCDVLAFQNGNDLYASAKPVMLSLSVGMIVHP